MEWPCGCVSREPGNLQSPLELDQKKATYIPDRLKMHFSSTQVVMYGFIGNEP